MKILIIEDEPSLREIIHKELVKEGYTVETADSFARAQDKIFVYNYDCILLDIMLPDGNGLEILEALKKQGKLENVIIISAKDSIEDKVAGLELGADDYLPKPFHLVELLARIKSVARRTRGGDRCLAMGNVQLNPESQRVTVDGVELPLLKKEYNILAYFMRRPDYVIDKEMLAESVWGDHVDQADTFNFVYSQIKNLRRKLSEAGATIEIKAVYGFGYKLTASD